MRVSVTLAKGGGQLVRTQTEALDSPTARQEPNGDKADLGPGAEAEKVSTRNAPAIDKLIMNPQQVALSPGRYGKAKASKPKAEERLKRMNLKKQTGLPTGTAPRGGVLIVESKQKLLHQKERAPMNIGRQ